MGLKSRWARNKGQYVSDKCCQNAFKNMLCWLLHFATRESSWYSGYLLSCFQHQDTHTHLVQTHPTLTLFWPAPTSGSCPWRSQANILRQIFSGPLLMGWILASKLYAFYHIRSNHLILADSKIYLRLGRPPCRLIKQPRTRDPDLCWEHIILRIPPSKVLVDVDSFNQRSDGESEFSQHTQRCITNVKYQPSKADDSGQGKLSL